MLTYSTFAFAQAIANRSVRRLGSARIVLRDLKQMSNLKFVPNLNHIGGAFLFVQ